MVTLYRTPTATAYTRRPPTRCFLQLLARLWKFLSRTNQFVRIVKISFTKGQMCSYDISFKRERFTAMSTCRCFTHVLPCCGKTCIVTKVARTEFYSFLLLRQKQKESAIVWEHPSAQWFPHWLFVVRTSFPTCCSWMCSLFVPAARRENVAYLPSVLHCGSMYKLHIV